MTETTPPPDPAGVPQADPPQPAPEGPVLQQNSILFALLGYASMFLGFPVFILPLAQRDDEFALYHARHAGAIYILGMILVVALSLVSFITCGFGMLLFPIISLVYIPTIHGMILAAQGEMREPVMTFGLGEKIFGGIKVHPKE